MSIEDERKRFKDEQREWEEERASYEAASKDADSRLSKYWEELRGLTATKEVCIFSVFHN